MIFKTDHLENSPDTMALYVFKAQWDFSAATQPLFPLKSDAEEETEAFPLLVHLSTEGYGMIVWKLASPVAYSVGCETRWLPTQGVSKLWYWLFVLPHLQNLGIAQTSFWIWQKTGRGRGTHIPLHTNKCKAETWGTVRRTNKAGNSLWGLMRLNLNTNLSWPTPQHWCVLSCLFLASQ